MVGVGWYVVCGLFYFMYHFVCFFFLTDNRNILEQLTGMSSAGLP